MTDGADTLEFDDTLSVADLGTYAARARALDADGAIRLVAAGPVLAAYVCVVPPAGLTGSGMVLGLRTYALRVPTTLDVTVPLAAIGDRTHRDRDEPVLPVPPQTVRTPWSGVSAPRSGWSDPVEVSADALAAATREGVESVAAGTPPNAGAAAVTQLRQRIWGAPALVAPGVRMPAGLAFANDALGFGAPAMLRSSGPWWRLSGPGGHALAK